MSASSRRPGVRAGSLRPPVIGITPEERDARGNIVLPAEYVDAVRRAGGLPIILPPWRADAAALLALVDGLILAGGGDIDPGEYGGIPHPEVYAVDVERDVTEIALVRGAVDSGLPTLGICRGAQIANVALGGTLIEHIEEMTGGDVHHRACPPSWSTHGVEIVAGSRLALALGMLSVQVRSWHHQAVRTPAARLAVVAMASDGVIEAVEVADHPYFVAVQWHPEMMAAADPAQQGLFDALVAAARARQ